MLGIEIMDVKYTPSVRYYYDVQLDDVALRLVPDCISAALAAVTGSDDAGKQMLQDWADGTGFKLISLDGRYKGLPRNRIEIWL